MYRIDPSKYSEEELTRTLEEEFQGEGFVPQEGQIVVFSEEPNEKDQLTKLAGLFREGETFVGAAQLPVKLDDGFAEIFQTISGRLTLAELIKRKLSSIPKNSCVNNLAGLTRLVGRIGTESSSGDAFKLCIPVLSTKSARASHASQASQAPCKYFFAIKSIFQSRSDSENAANKDVALREIHIMKEFNKLVERGLCPNLPIMYTAFYCGDCATENTAIRNRLEPDRLTLDDVVEQFTKQSEKYLKTYELNRRVLLRTEHHQPENEIKRQALVASLSQTGATLVKIVRLPCYIVANELADMDLHHWLDSGYGTLHNLRNALFQIVMGLLVTQKYLGFVHHDLHTGNVLVNIINPKGHYLYVVNGRPYPLNNNGFLMRLWDFGKSALGESQSSAADLSDLVESILLRSQHLSDNAIKLVKLVGEAAKRGLNYERILVHLSIKGQPQGQLLQEFRV
jgi:hypothetical protein